MFRRFVYQSANLRVGNCTIQYIFKFLAVDFDGNINTGRQNAPKASCFTCNYLLRIVKLNSNKRQIELFGHTG